MTCKTTIYFRDGAMRFFGEISKGAVYVTKAQIENYAGARNKSLADFWFAKHSTIVEKGVRVVHFFDYLEWYMESFAAQPAQPK